MSKYRRGINSSPIYKIMVRRGITGEFSAAMVSPAGAKVGAFSLYLHRSAAGLAAGKPAVDAEYESTPLFKQRRFS